jgi:hypothetical protein
MNELADAIYGTLSADAALSSLAVDGIVKGVHPQTEATRYVTYQIVTASPSYTMTAEANRSVRVQFKAWDQDLTSDTGNQMADRIEALMVRGGFTVSGWALKDVKLLDRHDAEEVYNNIVYPYTYLEHRLEMQRA